MKGCMLLTLIVALLYGVAQAGYKRCKYNYDCPRTKGKCYFYKCINYKCVKKNRYEGFMCKLKGCYEKAECDGYGHCECKNECDEKTNCVSDACTDRKCYDGHCQETCKKWCYDDYHNKGYCDKTNDYHGCGECKVKETEKPCEDHDGWKCECKYKTCGKKYRTMTTYNYGHCYEKDYVCCCHKDY